MFRVAGDYISDVVCDLTGNWIFKGVGSSVIGVVCFWIGGQDKLIEGLFGLMCLDFALGVAHGWKLGRISKTKFMGGVAKFLLYYLTLVCATILDSILNVKTDALLRVDFRGFLVIYFSLHESLSVLKHLHFFGVPLPEALMKRLADYRDCKLFQGKERAG